jgi:hypothetical protein
MKMSEDREIIIFGHVREVTENGGNVTTSRR